VLGDDQSEHSVAQELEALVRWNATGFGTPRAV